MPQVLQPHKNRELFQTSKAGGRLSSEPAAALPTERVIDLPANAFPMLSPACLTEEAMENRQPGNARESSGNEPRLLSLTLHKTFYLLGLQN